MKNIQTLSGLSPDNFREQIDNKETALYILRNESGAEVAITNYGAKIVSLMVPDKEGKMTDVVTGHDSIDAYLASEEPYFGAICGRYGNRIAKGKFSIDGITYDKLPINNGPNCLHGGIKGFNAVVWDATQVDERTIELRYTAADGEEGFPGELKTIVTYHLTDDNAVAIHYRATTDKPNYLPTDETAIPYGPKEKVEGTPMDFRTPHEVGERINDDFEQLRIGKGYDHTYILNKEGDELSFCARCLSPRTGIAMEVYTTQPGVQLYTGNWMTGNLVGKNGQRYPERAALCLETQHFPDSPNHPDYPTTLLRPGEVFQSTTIYRFSVEQI